jgi:hypothetical protein
MTKEWKNCKKLNPIGMEQSNSIFYAESEDEQQIAIPSNQECM